MPRRKVGRNGSVRIKTILMILLSVARLPVAAQAGAPAPAVGVPGVLPVAPPIEAKTLIPIVSEMNCEPVTADAGAWLRAAADVLLPDEGHDVLRLAGGYLVQLRNQSDRPAPPYIAAPAQASWWYDSATGDLLIGQSSGRATVIPLGSGGFGANLRGLVPWAVLHDWRAGEGRVRVVGRCPYLDYPRVVLERPGRFGPEHLWIDAATAVPVALVRTEMDPLLGPERAEYRWQGWWSAGPARFPIGATRYLDGEEAEARTLYPADVRVVSRDSLPAGATPVPGPVAPDVDTVRIGPSAFLLRSARFTEAVTLSSDTIVLMDAAAGEARARADSAWIARLFPGRHPVVLVVSSLAWPHFLGMRYWVARGAQVVVHPEGLDLLGSVLAKRWSAEPDALEAVRDSVAPVTRAVEAPTAIAGGGVELRPIRGVTGEGGLLAWLPGPRFVWASDRVQDVDHRNPYVDDLVWTVREDGLAPRGTSGPHLAIVPWTEVDALGSPARPAVPPLESSGRGTVAGPDSARALVLAGVEAMGGMEALRAIRGLRISRRSRESLVGVALDPRRPAGLWTVVDELRDPQAGASHERRSLEMMMREGAIAVEQVHAGVRSAAVVAGEQRLLSAEQGQADARRLALEPERMLLTALDSPDLRVFPGGRLDGVRYPAIAFQEGRTRILFHPDTHLPVALEQDTVLATDYTWSVWGDLTTRTVFGGWSLEPEGVRYPRRWDVERNGVPMRSVAVTGLDLSAPAPPDSFRIEGTAAPESPPVATSAVGPDSVIELDDGVLLLDGYFNVLLVAQDDGVVVIEPPHSSAYSDSVLAIAGRRFPKLPVKAVVATSFLWPHLGGVRAYVARHIPVYLPAANETLVRAMARAPHTRSPDAQSRAAAEPVLRSVGDRVIIGTGPNRIELHYGPTVGGDHGRRMMVAYLPGRRLLHAGDLFLPERFEPTMWRQAQDELMTLVRSRGMDVGAVTALHIEETPWVEVIARWEGGG